MAMTDKDRDDRPAKALAWAQEMFGDDVASDHIERATRALEEMLELAQAAGLPLLVAMKTICRVYQREPGLVPKEIGQAQLTLETLAQNYGYSASDQADYELLRIQAIPKEEWQKRHAAKVALGIAK